MEENTGFIPEIYIGENGNWFINNYDTGVKARGDDGITPHIGANGNWHIGETDTQVPATGPKGDKGDTGPMGPQGLTGAAGPQGATGPQGLTGPQGPTGATGPQGATGPKGDTGVAGPQGPTGATGPKGDPGIAGPQGAKGDKGDAGAAGAQGPQGPKGDKGEQGPAGPVNIVNNLDTTEEGYALDARQGKELGDKVTDLEGRLSSYIVDSRIVNGITYEKWSDGRLRMHGKGTSSSQAFATITFPVSFINTQYHMVAVAEYYSSSYISFLCSVQPIKPSFGYVYTRQHNGEAISGVSFHWIAEGRWK